MKTIICKFLSDGHLIKKTAVLNDSLDALSKSKKNEATEIIGPEWFDFDEWSIFFEISETQVYEIVCAYDRENCVKILKPIKAITWSCSSDNPVITDSQSVSFTIR